MVTLTLKTDAATYEKAHAGLIAVAGSAGLLFHSGREVPGGIAVIDFWQTAEAFQSFMGGPAGQGLADLGIPQPDDVAFTTVLTVPTARSAAGPATHPLAQGPHSLSNQVLAASTATTHGVQDVRPEACAVRLQIVRG